MREKREGGEVEGINEGREKWREKGLRKEVDG